MVGIETETPSTRARPRRRWRWRRGLAWAAALLATLLVAGAAGLATSASRAGLSVRAQAVRLSTIMLRDPPRDGASYRRQVESQQATGPSSPSTSFTRKYAVTSRTTAGSRVFTVGPRSGKSVRRVLFLHGGAYVADLTSPYWSLVGRLVDKTGARLVVPAYPLAPRHDWEPAHRLVLSLYRQLVETVGADKIVIAGDSAGGGLTVAIAEQLHEQRLPEPAGLVLYSPFLDATVSDPAQPALDRKDHVLSIHAVRQAGRWWAGHLPVTDPRISPLNGSLDGLPPITVFTGTDDLLHPDAVKLKTLADQDGVPCTLTTVRNEIHAWVVFFPDVVPEARRAIDESAGFIVARTSP